MNFLWNLRMRRRRYFERTCARGQWDNVLKHIHMSRHLDKPTKTGSTILHHVCCFQPPVHVVQEIISRYPGMIMVADICGRLPLHDACRYKASKEVVNCLVDAYSRATCIQDRQGKTPLHYAADAGFIHDYLLLDVILSLSVSNPHSLHIQDSRGWTPLDAIVRSCGRHSTELTTSLSEIAAMKEPLRNEIDSSESTTEPLRTFSYV